MKPNQNHQLLMSLAQSPLSADILICHSWKRAGVNQVNEVISAALIQHVPLFPQWTIPPVSAHLFGLKQEQLLSIV